MNRIIGLVSPLVRDVTYTSRAGLTRGLRRKGGLGFLPRRDNKEELFFRSLVPQLRGATVYDVGGYHGILTIFFAAHSDRVITFEPNPESRKMIAGNVGANRFDSRVTLLDYAVGSQPGTMTLRIPRHAPALGTLGGTFKDNDDCDSVEVSVNSIDTIIEQRGLPPPNFIKIDVEGFEVEVIRGLRKTLASYHPKLYIEIHGYDMKEKRRNSEGVLTLLADAGYQNPIHVETGLAADPDIAREGHIYAT